MSFLSSFHDAGNRLPGGEFSMWAPSASEPTFSVSETRASIGALYEAADRIESYVAAALLRQLGKVRRDALRVTLPEELATVHVKGPENQSFVISLSAEKGIRLHFRNHCAPAYRNRMVRSCTEFTTGLRAQLVASGVALDEYPSDGSPIGWWRICDEVMVQVETTSEPVQGVGTVFIP